MVAGLALATGGCGTREPAPTPRPPAVPSSAIAPSAADYLARAASLDLFEIEASKLALGRARTARTREFAAMMIHAHTGTSAQLSFAGRRLNLLPTTVMQPRHRAMIGQLAASVDFDVDYRRQQVAAHEDALRLHSGYAARGRSPTLRPIAANAVPILRRHLALLRRM